MTKLGSEIHVYCYLIVYPFCTLPQRGVKTFGDSSAFLPVFHLVVTSWILNANKMSAMVGSITRDESNFLAPNMPYL